MKDSPLLLLHPLGADGDFWSPVSGLLGRECLAPDLPGHGRAASPSRGDLAEYSRAASAVAESCGRRVVVVGLSLGGLVAQDLVRTRPDLLAGLVLADTVAVYPSPLRESWITRAATARTRGMGALVDAMEKMWFSPGLRDRLPDVVAAARATFVTTDPEGYALTCEALHRADTRSALPAATPTMVICGQDDLRPFRDAAMAMAAVSGTEARWLEGTRHACALEAPEAFANLLEEFFAVHDL